MEIALVIALVLVVGLAVAAVKVMSLLSEAKVAEATQRATIAANEKRLEDMEAHYLALLAESKNQFKALSTEVLKESREEFAKSGVDGIKRISDSLKQDIVDFKRRLNEVNEQDVGRAATMKAEIANLLNQSNKVSEEANNLAKAIRGNAQLTGQWAEMQLKKVLELGGLSETIDYTYQETFASPDSVRKDQRTDVLVKLPDNRWLVIDSKATVDSYVELCASEAGDDDYEKAYAKIVKSLKAHVEEIKKADYAKNIEKTQGVKVHEKMLMYVPFEEVYLIAMKAKVDGTRLLRDWAWENDVVIVNSACLLPIARMLARFWEQNKADKKAYEIIDRAEKLLEKCATFVDGFIKVGADIKSSVDSYNAALKLLATGKGNVMKQLADLNELGVKLPAKAKKIGEVEEKLIAAGVERLEPSAAAHPDEARSLA